MKKAFLFAASFILLAFVISSCKKDKDSKSQTVAEKIQHNWTIESYVYNYHDATGDDIDTTKGEAGDFVNFKADGTVITHFFGLDDTNTYSIISDTQISIDGETFTIEVLTTTKLVLYVKDVDPAFPGEYEEQTMNLKRG